MSAFRYILASLRQYRRVHLAVALGVAVATATLTGALVVGDSVRGSLRDLTIQRLGRIDSVLVTGHFFREDLASELADAPEFQKYFARAEPAILTRGALQSGDRSERRRATNVSVVGCRPGFWELGQGGPSAPLAGDECAITEPLARELDIQPDGELLLRVPFAGAIPSDSPLGEKSDTSLARRLKVAAVLPPDGLARFGLVPSQHLPRNLFLPLGTMQSLLDERGRANAILVATETSGGAAGAAANRALRRALAPRLEDYGIGITLVESPINYLQISAQQMVLPDEVVRAAAAAFGANRIQPVVTYLANTLVAGEGTSERRIPYSTITGVDSTAKLGPLFDASGEPLELADDEIVLNRWAADDLQVEIGDRIAVRFYEPESTHGRLREHEPPATFRLRAVVDLETTAGMPTPAADPKLTPDLPGVTDQKSIDDWELPFELVEKIRPQDEEYWDDHRTTPKAFVSLATAKRLWQSRWGTISLLRLEEGNPVEGSDSQHVTTVNVAAEKLTNEIKPESLGMTFSPVKQLGLEASSGTTPFDILFLLFSMFLIAAAIMLIALLFQLGIEERAAELGTLSAIGLDKHIVSRLLSREALLVTAVGAAAGVVFGVFYAWALVEALRTWWVAAIATPFLKLHFSWPSLVYGWIVGMVASWLTIRWCIARMVRRPAARLLAGSTVDELASSATRPARIWPIARFAVLAVVAAVVGVGLVLVGDAQAGAFFASGGGMLVLLLGEIRYRMRFRRRANARPRTLTLSKLSALNTARNPARSTLTIGLMAAASFLIVAVSAFRLENDGAGTGGFDLLATSDLPIHFDLNSTAGRQELGFSEGANKQMENWRVYSLRSAGGEDASCLNLYRPSQPQVLGLPEEFVRRGGFPATDSLELRSAGAWHFGNGFNSLYADLGKDEHDNPVVPVILDANTATYSLKLSGVGSRLTIRDGDDQPVTLEVAGLLKNSVLQGRLLMSEANFLRLFPDAGGYQFFCIERLPLPSFDADSPTTRASRGNPRETAQLLESALADFGFDAVDANEQLAAYLAVQNTYLSTFQSLGALGLLLGTAGLAAVQLRSVMERRGELALMRAAGFRRARLTWMVLWENAVLLVGGLVVGCIAAGVALIPRWTDAGVPWLGLLVLLAAIAAVGLSIGWLATRAALRAPILPALRGD